MTHAHAVIRPALLAVATAALLVLPVACSGPGKSSGPAGQSRDAGAQSISLYTSANQQTVDAVLAPWKKRHPNTTVRLFRAPTGQINARLASEQRAGGVRADVIWGPDPVTFYGYDSQKMLLHWTPSDVANVPTRDRGPTFWGTTVLRLVIVVHRGTSPMPQSWRDLTAPALRGEVEVPNPGFASSAMGELAYFAQSPAYGLDYFRRLKANGAVQVDSPDTVLTDVATGRKKAGIALDFSAEAAKKQGSPIELVYPEPGAIGVYGAAGVVKASAHQATAKQLVEYLLTKQAQLILEKMGRQPILPSAGSTAPAGTRTVTPDWAALATSKDRLLRQYQTIFGGPTS